MNPKENWEKLRSDAKNDPLKLKKAVFAFMDKYARNPDAVSIIPEILKTASHLQLSPDEKSKLLISATETQNALLPGLILPLKGNRPELSIQLNPFENKEMDIYTPLIPSNDVNHLLVARETMLHIKKVKKDETKR